MLLRDFKLKCDINDVWQEMESEEVGSDNTDGKAVCVTQPVTDIGHNPHLWQLSSDFVPLYPLNDLPRTLSQDSPQLPYRRRRGERKTLVHWGQRKLLLSEIEFLTKYAPLSSSSDRVLCLYCGAAPGIHISYLSQLFPHISFVLIDPAPFFCTEAEKIVIRNEYMTDAIAQEYRNSTSTVLFISDIRSADWMLYGNNLLEKEIINDMEDQMRWHEILSPRASMMKFRLPWTVGTTMYLSGEIFLPLWGPQTTTESRLVVQGNEKRPWDHQKYWEQMFYFNTVTRCSAYHHTIQPLIKVGKLLTPTLPKEFQVGQDDYETGDEIAACSSCVDYCYDCAGEIVVLQEYLHKSIKESRLHGIDENNSILTLIDEISQACLHLDPPETPTRYQRKRSRKTFSLEDDFITTCPTTAHTLDLLRTSCSSSQLVAPISQRHLFWMTMSPPDMSDLSHNDCGELGLLGLGDNIPPNCALEIWLWRVLDSHLAVPQLPHPSLPFTNLDDLLLDVNQKLQILDQILQSQSNVVPVVVLFVSSGETYLYHTLPSNKRKPTVTRIHLPPLDWPETILSTIDPPQVPLTNLPILFVGYLSQDSASRWSLFLSRVLRCNNSLSFSMEDIQEKLSSVFDFQNIPWKMAIFSVCGLKEITIKGSTDIN